MATETYNIDNIARKKQYKRRRLRRDIQQQRDSDSETDKYIKKETQYT